MRVSPVYRHIERRTELLGLEVPVDLFVLGAFLGVAMFVGAGPLYLVLALVALYALLRFLKRGKPGGYLGALLRYAGRPPVLSAAAPDVAGRLHPFVPSQTTSPQQGDLP